MKKSKIAIIIIMILSVVITGVSLVLLPDTIPTHIGINGVPDQYGSKYFMLLFPTLIIIVGAAMLLTTKYSKSENYKKYLLVTGVLIELIFTTMLIVFCLYVLSYKENGKPFDISKIIMIVFGLLFILMGNYMPKIQKNKTLGFRTRWSLYNEVTWQKTHRFVGYAGIIIGILSILSGIFFKEIVNFIVLMTLVMSMMISTAIASYNYYKEEKTKEK